MIVVKSILVPTDFSETSDAALNYGIGLALTFGARLYLLHDRPARHVRVWWGV